jgi:hypothetical protein
MEWKDFYERIPGTLHDIKREELGEGDCAVVILSRDGETKGCFMGCACDMATSIEKTMRESEGLRKAIMMASMACIIAGAGKTSEEATL